MKKITKTLIEFGVPTKYGNVYTIENMRDAIDDFINRSAYPIYGEFEHPNSFDTSLSRVSHKIDRIWLESDKKTMDEYMPVEERLEMDPFCEEIWEEDYCENPSRLMADITILNTEFGKVVQELDEDDYFFGIRAAGRVDENGEKKIIKLFTFDICSNPLKKK